MQYKLKILLKQKMFQNNFKILITKLKTFYIKDFGFQLKMMI